MKQIVFIVFLLLIFFLNIEAQVSEEISQLKPFVQPTKDELKRTEKLIKKSGWKKIICVVGVDPESIELSIDIETEIMPDGKKVSVIKAELNSYDWSFVGDTNDELKAKLIFFGRITSNDKKLDGTFEERKDFTLKKEQLDKPAPLFYKKIFELPDGKYSLMLATRDINIGLVGIKRISFEVK